MINDDWTPKVGDLLCFCYAYRKVAKTPGNSIHVDVSSPTSSGFKLVNADIMGTFVMLGILDHEARARALYTDAIPADFDPCPPQTTYTAWFWCLGPDGVVAISRLALQQV